MFYVRTNTTAKKVIEKNVSLEEGLIFLENSIGDLSLMYKLPSGKGIKVMTTESSKKYHLMLEGYPTKKSQNIISTNTILKDLYLDVKDLNLDTNFNGKISIRETETGSELALFTKGSALDSIIKDISIPLHNLEQSKPKEEDTTIESCTIAHTPVIDVIDDITTTSTKKDTTIIETIESSPKVVGNGKFVSYNISGTLRSGSSVILSERIHDYKYALEKYNEAKEVNSNNYTEICLNGFREDGSSSVRFKKSYEPDVLSYEYISSFVKDLAERLKLLNILEVDAKAAMAIEDKRYNAAYHIMEACDMDFEDPSFKDNMINMKIAADKRRDMKKTVALLSKVNGLLSFPDTLINTIDNSINKIDTTSSEGIDMYKGKSTDDFVKEYEIDDNTINLGEIAKSKLTVRPLLLEGKMVAYEKHYK